jgi:sugar O-acyltransferase (sialic acid O-acetyltransferase NeuD family)
MAKYQGKIVIHGAGGHGRVVADAAKLAGFEILGFLDDGLPVGHLVLNWRVLGDSTWPQQGKIDVAVALGVGSNEVRARVAAELKTRGTPLATIVHPSAVVSPYARIGAGAVVLALAVVNACAEVERGTIINTASIIEHDVRVGDFAHVASGAGLAGAARIDSFAMLGSGARVLPGVSIGSRSVVGAGAVVTRDIPADCIAVGVPARIVRFL